MQAHNGTVLSIAACMRHIDMFNTILKYCDSKGNSEITISKKRSLIDEFKLEVNNIDKNMFILAMRSDIIFQANITKDADIKIEAFDTRTINMKNQIIEMYNSKGIELCKNIPQLDYMIDVYVKLKNEYDFSISKLSALTEHSEHYYCHVKTQSN